MRVKAATLGVLATAIALAPAGGSASGPGSAAVATKDYGDAPDGRVAYLARPRNILGRFPSRERSDGARHSRFGPLRLGSLVNGEGDSRQVNQDRGDDGFFVQLEPCRVSRLTFVVDARKLPAELRAAGHTAFLNAWFDWTHDGDWGDVDRCARTPVPEHRVQNVPLDLASFAREPIQAIRVTALAGRQVGELWYRATLTLDEPLASPLGAGSFTHGETEDYLFSRLGRKKPPPPPPKQFDAKCSPNPAFIEHGRKFVLPFTFGPPGAKPTLTLLSVTVSPKSPPVKVTQTGPHTITVEAKQDPPSRVQVVKLQIRFRRGAKSVVRTCEVRIWHGKVKGAPPGRGLLIGPPPLPRPECSDAKDNDGDRRVDHPADGGCDGPDDASELGQKTDKDPFRFTCPGPNQSSRLEFNVFIPKGAQNPTHEILDAATGQPVARPICPGTTETETVNPDAPPPPDGTVPEGKKNYRITVEIPGQEASAGQQRQLKIRVRWT